MSPQHQRLTMAIAVIAITRNGAKLATTLRNGLGDEARVHVLRKYVGQAGKNALPFGEGELPALLAGLWHEATGIVCIMATGIVVRMIAPLLQGKDTDPAVVVMDEAGKFAISLLSGHLGGANDLAKRCAFVCGARPVITTATDVNALPSFDLLAKEQGWLIDDLSRVKTLNSLLLDNEPIAVVDDTGLVRGYFHGRGNLLFCETFVAGLRSNAKGFLFVTNSVIPPQLQSERLLVLRPRNLFLGIGCNSGTTVEEIDQVVTRQFKRLFLSRASICGIATADAKREEPGLVAFAATLGVPLQTFPSEALNGVEVPSPPSPHALQAIGATGVAEPAALLAADDGHLLLKKVKDGNVTLAIAERTHITP
jgi:cobalt-precorrin 5A hydrolase